MPTYNCKLGTTTGSHNVQYEKVTANNESEAVAAMNKKYTYENATYTCTLEKISLNNLG